MDTSGQRCNHVKYEQSNSMMIISTNNSRKQKAMISLNRRLSGKPIIQCDCFKCSTRGNSNDPQ